MERAMLFVFLAILALGVADVLRHYATYWRERAKTERVRRVIMVADNAMTQEKAAEIEAACGAKVVLVKPAAFGIPFRTLL